MKYFKMTEKGFIFAAGVGLEGTQITEDEYLEIKDKCRNKPAPPEGSEYLLSESLEWVLVENPEADDPELTDAEALEIILGGVGA